MMNLLYRIFINLTILFLPVIAVFNKKIKSYWVHREKLVKTDFNLNDQF